MRFEDRVWKSALLAPDEAWVDRIFYQECFHLLNLSCDNADLAIKGSECLDRHRLLSKVSVPRGLIVLYRQLK